MTNRGDKSQGRVLWAAGLVSALFGALATLLGVGYLRQKDLQRQAAQQSVRATEQALRARDAANRGTRAREEAEALVGFILEDLSQDLEEIGRTDLMLAAASKAVDYFDNLPPELTTSDSRAKQAAMITTLAQSHYTQGDQDKAIALMQRSVQIRRALVAQGDPTGEQTFDLARDISELALFQNQAGNDQAARQSYEETLRIFQNPPAGAIRDGHWEFGLATAYFGLGETERLGKRYPEALHAYQAAAPHVAAALAKQPDNVNWLKKRMNLQNNRGVVLMHQGNFAAAETNYLQAVVTARELVRLEPQYRRWEKELAATLMNVGTCLDEQHHYDRAEPFIRESLRIRDGLAAWDSKNTRNLRSLAHGWHNLASLLFSTSRPTEGLESARQCLTTFHRLLTLESGKKSLIDDMKRSTDRFRDYLVTAGLTNAALQLAEETIAFAEAKRAGKPGADAWEELLAGLYQDARQLGGKGGSAAMLESQRQGVAHRAAQLTAEPDNQELIYRWATACLNLGRSYQDAGFTDAALDCTRLARVVLREWLPEDYPYRKLYLDDAERLEVSLSLRAGVIRPPPTLIPAGATWRYWDQRGSPGTNWAELTYDDSSWKQGPAPLGYGESDLSTTIGFGESSRDKNLTSWFRCEFNADHPEAWHDFHMSLRRDDGLVLYLNGREILRDAMPRGPITPTTAAQMTQGDEERIFHIFTLTKEELPLRPGRNVLAAELHQNEPQSSDLAFDLELLANFVPPNPERNLNLESLKKTLGDALPEAWESRLR